MLLHLWVPLIWNAPCHCSEKVELWPFNPYGMGGSAGKIYATMLLHFVIPIDFICYMTMFWKSWIMTFWTHPLGSWVMGFCGKDICYHIAAFLLPFNLICNMTLFWINCTLASWPLWSEGGGSAGQISATMLLHLWIPLIWYATWPYSEKVEVWPHPVSVGACMQAKCLLPCCCISWFPLLWYATWPCFEI